MKEAHELEATLKLDLTLIFNVPTAQPLHLTRKSVNFITPAITDLPWRFGNAIPTTYSTSLTVAAIFLRKWTVVTDNVLRQLQPSHLSLVLKTDFIL